MTTTPEKNQGVETPWEITCKRFVAFIDIMGFKDMVMKSTHNDIYSMMKKIKNEVNRMEGHVWNTHSKKMVRATTYSDSIIMYSRDDTDNSLDAIISTVAVISSFLLEEGIPYKGAVSFGDMTLDTNNSIFFGQPLIDAYLLQEELSYYGIIIHGSCEKIIAERNYKIFIRSYLCPLKNVHSNHLVVLPMFLLEQNAINDAAKEKRKKLLESLNNFRYNTSGHIRKYIDNTQAFFDFMNDK